MYSIVLQLGAESLFFLERRRKNVLKHEWRFLRAEAGSHSGCKGAELPAGFGATHKTRGVWGHGGAHVSV